MTIIAPHAVGGLTPLRPAIFIAHGLAVGTLWMASVGHWYYAWQLPRDKIQQDVTLSGTVVDARCRPDGHTYTLTTRVFKARGWPGRRAVRLHEQSDYPCLQAGTRITATVVLKPAYGTANPIGFNFQQYLTSQGIVATGYVRQRHVVFVPAPSLRQRLQRLIQSRDHDYQRWLLLLLTGDKSKLRAEDWALLRRTGTGHLFSISGLHLGIIAAALFPLTGFIVGLLVSRCTWIPTRAIWPLTLLAVALLTGLYAQIAGAALPVIRAWVLLIIGLLLALTRRNWNGLHVGLCMLSACIILFPLSVLSAGFYLSSGAVLAIWLLLWRYRWYQLRWYQLLWRLQLALSLTLLPVVVSWFSVMSVSAIPVNLLLVPLMSVVLPVLLLLLLLAWGIPPVSDSSLWLAHRIMGSLIDAVAWLDKGLPVPLTLFPPNNLMVIVAVITLLVVLPPFAYRRLAIALLTLPLAFSFVPFSSRFMHVHVLDAGQGTAVIVTRGRHAMVVDTGPAHNGVAPVTEYALIPLLKRHRLHLDHIIVSHNDNDHAGGAKALQDYLNRAGQSPRWYRPHQGCYAGKTLHWQQVEVHFLWPERGSAMAGNNGSCVVMLDVGAQRLLLPGDIERSAEYSLLAGTPGLRASIMLAPHHGSDTSSTGALIEAVSPQTVIFTQGFENRWGFPERAVVERYRARGVRMMASSESGYIRLTFAPQRPVRIESMRHTLRPRWYFRARQFHTMD
ncbi:DNA internalization-related competence protein ComEC/Rec2 [Alteromonas halophila]|uniref:DNA internalization-related competence protein ComEC/Rec2 n=1 Tax=Alteromonas halophila TaxID=516698 RepID=A0A918JLB3_9ALTE|nr:DNA internalization-related competence protein ComEC/Rec2 [Alteromonas halophila]